MPPRYLLFSLLLIAPIFTLTLPGCAICKSTDSAEVCRTKERDHHQPRVQYPYGIF
jgi:hypothetical protein